MLTVSGKCMCDRCEGRTTDQYRMVGKCSNCGAQPILMLFRSGDRASTLDCPTCGVRSVMPLRLATELDERFHFDLDVCATPANAKCARYFTIDDDGLEQPWDGRVYCNPPYSQLGPWVEKAWAEWRRVTVDEVSENGTAYLTTGPDLIVMLLPANRPEQKWWQELVEPYRDRQGSPLRTEFLRGRPRFVMPGAEEIGPNERPPFGCVLLVWSRDQVAPEPEESK